MKIEAQQLIYAVLEQALNRYLELDPDYAQKLSPLYGSIIEIELSGLALRIFLRTDEKGIICQGNIDSEPDCIIKGTPFALMKMSFAEKAEQMTGLFSGEVEISGDVQLGQKMKQVLDSIDIDWEEHLSHITGDVVAYRTGQVVKQGLAWLQDSSVQMRDNVRDYFIYESEDLPQSIAVAQFITQVDILRDDVARAQARVHKIIDKLENS